MTHVLYQTGDAGTPDVVKDRNGDVVLGLCKVCGKAEAELDTPCTPTLLEALEASVSLQSHYAAILNDYDGGKRTLFASAQAWIDRLAVLRPVVSTEHDVILNYDKIVYEALAEDRDPPDWLAYENPQKDVAVALVHRAIRIAVRTVDNPPNPE